MLMVHVRILVVMYKMIANLNIDIVMSVNNSLLVTLQLTNPVAAMLFVVHKMDIIKELNTAIAVLDVTDIFNMIGVIILMVDKITMIGMIILMVDELTMIDMTILKTDVILMIDKIYTGVNGAIITGRTHH